MFPDVFVRKFKSVNAQFAGATHQDAQEFLNFILNDLSECLRQDAINDRSKDKHISRTGRHNDNFPFKNNPENIDISGRGQENATGDSKKTKKKAKKVIRKLSRALRDIQNVYSNENSNNSNDSYPHHHDHGAKGEINRSFQSSQSSHYTNECNEDKTTADKTWIEELFQGQISNETTCLNCKTVKSRQVQSFSVIDVIYTKLMSSWENMNVCRKIHSNSVHVWTFYLYQYDYG